MLAINTANTVSDETTVPIFVSAPSSPVSADSEHGLVRARTCPADVPASPQELRLFSDSFVVPLPPKGSKYQANGQEAKDQPAPVDIQIARNSVSQPQSPNAHQTSVSGKSLQKTADE